jgi:hypothetical protein
LQRHFLDRFSPVFLSQQAENRERHAIGRQQNQIAPAHGSTWQIIQGVLKLCHPPVFPLLFLSLLATLRVQCIIMVAQCISIRLKVLGRTARTAGKG